MPLSRDAIDIFLQPGEVYFGDRSERIRTLLGSCVAITLWHAKKQVGGMCHYMLSKRRAPRGRGDALDGRYADEALQLLLREIEHSGGDPREYQVKLFGGGNMFAPVAPPGGQPGGQPGKKQRGINVADDNVLAGRALLAQHGFIIAAEQLGGHGHRQVIFDIASGDVWVKRHRVQPVDGIPRFPKAEARP